MIMNLRKQKGGSLVEMAIVLLFFLMIIFAVMEFSIAVVRSAQLAEATRYGLRYAIVNDPLVTLPSCPGVMPSPVDASVEMLNGMQNIAPIIKTQANDGLSVKVKYACPSSDYVEHQHLYLVTVTVSGAKHYLTVPGVLGLDVAINLQPFRSTRLSEDLHTPVSGG
jgi:hypothetical protein